MLQLSIYDEEDGLAEAYELVEEQALLQPYFAVVRRQVWAFLDLCENGGRTVETAIHKSKLTFYGAKGA